MRHVLPAAGLAAILLLTVASPFRAPGADANHDDGHMHDWFVGPPANTGILQEVPLGQASLCSPEFPSSTQTAAMRWRDTAGTDAGNVVNLFNYQSSCAGADVIVTRQSFFCGSSHACTQPTEPTLDNDHGIVLPITIRMNPTLFGPGQTWQDGDSHTTRDIAHELGHALGHADYSGCPGGTPTLMDTTEGCFYTTPQPLDETNFHNGYHIDAVSSFNASASAAHQVTLTWSQSNIHNESSYVVQRLEACAYSWVPVAWVAKNTTSTVVNSQQGGPQTYRIYGVTNADPTHGGLGDIVTDAVTVTSTLSAPSYMLSRFIATPQGTNRLYWPAVSGAHHYHVRTDFNPGGLYCASTGDVTATAYDAAVPGPAYDGVQWYNKVLACTAADLCSPLSTTHTLTERANVNGWNYAFTYNNYWNGIHFQFVNFMNSPTELALALHVTNGNQATSPKVATIFGQEPTPCIPYNTISGVYTYLASAFTNLTVGTLGHDVLNASQCDTGHTNDGTDNRWGYLVPSGF